MGDQTIAEDRPLSDSERAIITWLLEHGSNDSRAYLSQLSEVRVIGRCGCGCPSIDFTKLSGMGDSIANYVGVTPEGVEVGVMLRGREGTLYLLEVYCFGENDGPFSLPEISSLKPF